MHVRKVWGGYTSYAVGVAKDADQTLQQEIFIEFQMIFRRETNIHRPLATCLQLLEGMHGASTSSLTTPHHQ